MTDQISPQKPANVGGRRRQRGRFAAVALWLPVIAISITATMWFPLLPARFHLQWLGIDVAAPGVTVLAIAGLGTVALLAAVLGLIALVSGPPRIRRGLVLGAGIVAGMSAGTWFTVAGLILVDGSREQDLGLWPLLALAAGAYGFVPFALAPTSESPAPNRLSPASNLARSETAAWYTTLLVPTFGWLAFGLFAAAGSVALIGSLYPFTGGTSATIILFLVAAVCLGLSRVRVTADMRGLRVVSGVFRVPLASIRLEHISSAYSENTHPGGWGYRALPGRTTLILGRGPSLVVQRTNGTLFSVSVPQPDHPAALLTTLAAR